MSSAAPATTAPLRVLVVDDNPALVRSFSRLISRWGYDCAVAHDGPGALAAAVDFRPDLALLDLEMPGMDGYEVARRLRGLPGLEGVVLIAVTGYEDEAHRRRCDGAGFAFYFVKPADPAGLEQLLGALAREKMQAG
jgi:CheY-like chemotaxis protein